MLKPYETDRLILMSLSKEAAPMVLDFYEENRDIFEPWEPKRSDNFYTLSYQKASLSAEYNQMAEGKLLRYWVFRKDNPDEIIGSVCFQCILGEPYQSCILGYKFALRYHHKGYAYESVQKCIDIIFKEYDIHRIEAYIMPNNAPSIRLIERLHFSYEGLSHSYANINGNWSDHERYAMLNPIDSEAWYTNIPFDFYNFL
jgi:[ribosomal protein S5]-alanine N-acetyltransferase